MEVSPEKLIRDFRMVMHDAEELIKATSGDAGDRTREARAKLAVALVVARETCSRLEDAALAHTQVTGTLFRGAPYAFIGVAFGVGLLLGLGVPIRRRTSS